MFASLAEALRNKDVRNRLIFTIIAFMVFDLMVHITVPLVDPSVLNKIEASTFLGFANVLSGGALKKFSIIAMGVSPYITASIVIQLLEMDIIPVLAEWSKEGESGKAKIKQVTRYSSLALAFVQGLAMAIGFEKMYSSALFISSVTQSSQGITMLMYVYIALVMTAGTAAILWIADQITAKGVGNGTSMIIMAGIVATFPSMLSALFNQYIVGYTTTTNSNGQSTTTLNSGFSTWALRTDWRQPVIFLGVLAIFAVIIVAIIYMQNAVRKIPIQYANRANSATLTGQKDSHLPIKLNPSGVIPVVFAASLVSLPLTFATFATNANTKAIIQMIFDYTKPIGFVLYILLIYLFSFFYAFVQVSPEKVADNLRKQGSFIPGVRPGKETENFVSGVLMRTTVIGSTYLLIVAVIPILFTVFTNVPSTVRVGGTSLLIVVGVAQELFKQIETKSKAQKYSGFIK